MKIIGHRGAAGLALENTLPSLELARLLGVDAIEIDIRKTKDNHLVLCHDSDLSDVSISNEKIKNLTLSEIQKITLNDEVSVAPSLQQALRMTGTIPVMIEIKESGCAELLLEVIKEFPKAPITIVSFKLDELAQLRKLQPSLKLYNLENTKPFDCIQFARELKLSGIGLNFWLLNPLTYWLARRFKLDVFVFTVNNKVLGRFLSYLYKDVAICTDHPEFFIKHPYLRLRSNRSWNMSQTKSKRRRRQE